MMNCHEFESQINEILDARERPVGDPRIAAHAGQCEACAQLLAGYEQVLATLPGLPVPPAGKAFARRVVSLAAKPAAPPVSPRSAGRGWLAAGTLLAAAASVLLLASVVWFARQPERLALQDADSAPGDRAPDHRRPAMPGGSLALGQSNWIIEAPRLPSEIRRNYRGTIDDLATTLPQTIERLDEVERYAPGIKPLRVSFTVLIQALWRAIPGSEGDAPASKQTTAWPAGAASLA